VQSSFQQKVTAEVAMTETQNANERFNRLWDEIGAERIIVGDEEKVVQIVVDADLSPFAILEKLKDEVGRKQGQGDLSSADTKALIETTDAIRKSLTGGFFDRLKRGFT
jgi:hypothetical protein